MTSRGRWVAAALAAVLLAGCAVGPDHVQPSVALPGDWRADAQAADPGKRESASVLDRPWWAGFADPMLKALVDEALVSNLDIELAALRVQEYDARLQIDRAARYPELGAGAEAIRQRISQQRPVDLPLGVSPSQSRFQLSASIGWEIDLWGRVRRSNEAALAELLSTGEARRGVMLTVATTVATSYVQLLVLDEELAVARTIADNRKKVLELVRLRAEGGASTGLAVAKAQADLAAAQAVLPDLERQITQLENAISVLIGRNPGPVSRGRLQALTEPGVPAGLPSDLLWRRPDLLAAEQDLIAANARIGVAKAAFFPTISLTSVFGFSSNELASALNRSANFGEIGPSLLGTIFSGGRLSGNVRAAEAGQQQRLLRYRQVVQLALRDVEDALAGRARRVEQGKILQEWMAASADVLRLTEARQTGGLGTLLEVLDAERETLVVQRELVRNRGESVTALVAVYKAMGGGWMDAPELPVRDPDEGALAVLQRLR